MRSPGINRAARVCTCITAITIAAMNGCDNTNQNDLPRHVSGLQGSTAHEFSAVPVGGPAGELSHTFVLRHMGNTPLTINAIKTTCGCVGATPSTRHVNPGDVLTIDTRMKLGGIGRKEVVVSVGFVETEIPPLVLSLAGQGTPRLALMVRPEFARADTTRKVVVNVSLVTPEQDPPPQLHVICPDGVHWRSKGWVALPSAATGPRRFERQVELMLPEGFNRGIARIGVDGHPDRIVQVAATDG